LDEFADFLAICCIHGDRYCWRFDAFVRDYIALYTQASKHHLYRHAVKKVPKSELTNLLPNKRAAAFWA
jgi:hypothetical protein